METSGKYGDWRKWLRLKPLRGDDFFLVTQLLGKFSLIDIRGVFICAVRVMYYVWMDDTIRQIVINVVDEYKSTDSVKEYEKLVDVR